MSFCCQLLLKSSKPVKGAAYAIEVQKGSALTSVLFALCTDTFNVQQLYVLPTQCIYVFCVDLRTNSETDWFL
jgi:hypothetical protein